MSYWTKTPKWLKKLFPKELVWNMPVIDVPTVYLTFDDGPHPMITPFVLDQLQQYNATATFFCIGKNVELQPIVYEQILAHGHTVGNHTQDHIDGWKVDNRMYIRNILKAKQHITSTLFRPPYGHIKISQAQRLYKANAAWTIYMWDVVSADYDANISKQECLDNVLANIEPGSIVVFHDSEKAWERMSYALPRVLAYCQQNNWQIKALPKH